MAIVPTTFRKAPAALVSYDYVDFASGTGYVTFHPGKVAGPAYIMSPSVFYSDGVTTTGTGDYATYTQILDLDFDVELNLPRTIEGDCFISVPMGVVPGPADTLTTFGLKYTATVRKVVGGTEEDLGTADCTPYSLTAVSNDGTHPISRHAAVKITLPRTHFKSGDVLRLNIVLFGKANNTGVWGIGHDPRNRDDDTLNNTGTVANVVILTAETDSRMDFLVPFKLDT